MPLLGTIGEASARAYGLYGNRKPIQLTIAANTFNYDVFTNAAPAYTAGQSDIVVTINPGVTVGSTATPTYAMLVPSAFSPTDTVTIINNGTIQGMGGAGGPGGAVLNDPTGSRPGNAGSTGGNAVFVNRPTVITNHGTIAAGGGGGGGGGASAYLQTPTAIFYTGGSGGGGGAGTNGGGAGSGGPVSPLVGNNPSPPGNAGSAGTSPAGGAGGPRRNSPSPSFYGGAGGTGGGRGAAGATGETGSGNTGPAPVNRPGGGGGGAGNYIVGNPFVTWPVTGTRQGGVA